MKGTKYPGSSIYFYLYIVISSFAFVRNHRDAIYSSSYFSTQQCHNQKTIKTIYLHISVLISLYMHICVCVFNYIPFNSMCIFLEWTPQSSCRTISPHRALVPFFYSHSSLPFKSMTVTSVCSLCNFVMTQPYMVNAFEVVILL